MNLLLINGPNLNLTGIREKDIYGTKTLTEIENECESLVKAYGGKLTCFQSNYEGKIIDAIQEARELYDGIVINPGALAHYSYAVYDAIRAVDIPVIEVHMSDIMNREAFRRVSVTAAACADSVIGQGSNGYLIAIEKLLKL